MIHPAPTTPIKPTVARGELVEIVPATATRSGHVVLTFGNTSYQMHLVPTAPVTTPIGKRIMGTIRCKARRVDVVETGGRYVEPVYGRPRRVQGTVVAAEPSQRVIVVDAGMPIHCELQDARQEADQFPIGAFVSFDAMDGATFTQA